MTAVTAGVSSPTVTTGVTPAAMAAMVTTRVASSAVASMVPSGEAAVVTPPTMTRGDLPVARASVTSMAAGRMTNAGVTPTVGTGADVAPNVMNSPLVVKASVISSVMRKDVLSNAVLCPDVVQPVVAEMDAEIEVMIVPSGVEPGVVVVTPVVRNGIGCNSRRCTHVLDEGVDEIFTDSGLGEGRKILSVELDPDLVGT